MKDTTSILIPFRDKVDLTNDCLRTLNASLTEEERAGVEVILVNNRSQAAELAKLVIPAGLQTRRLDLDIDFNFQTVNNRGAAEAKGELLLLLNNDILFPEPGPEGPPGWLTRMIQTARRPDVGAVGPLLYYPDGTIQHAGVVVGMSTYADHLYRGWTEAEADAYPFTSYKEDRFVSAVTAAFLFVEARKFRQVGGMDERFIVCGGDVDLCIRLTNAGYRSVYLGSVKAFHLESKSRTGSPIPEVDFIESRRSYGAFLAAHGGRDPCYPAPLALDPIKPSLGPGGVSGGDAPTGGPGAGPPKPLGPKQNLKRYLRDKRQRYREIRNRMRTEPLELIIAHKLLKLRRRLRTAKVVSDNASATDVQYLRLPEMAPLRTHVETPLSPRLRLNVLLPHYNDHGVFAGIITACAVGAKVALSHPDVSLRFVFVDGIAKLDALRRDVRSFLGPQVDRLEFTSAEVYDRAHASLNTHAGDHFLATAWWTCYPARSMLAPGQKFIYLIQDFECGFYAWSDWYANCLASYAMSYMPVFNTTILRDYFLKMGLIPKAQIDAGAAFDPAVSRALFSVPRRRKAPGEKRRLFFYGREGIQRNLFPIGVVALADAISAGVLDPARWEFLSAGQPHAPVSLGKGAVLRSVGKMSLADYAKFLSETDIGVCLMLSPHPSYPPLEVAAAGALSITNTFENKDLSRLSPNIISCAPSIDGVVDALSRAAQRLETETLDAPRPLDLPESWDQALAGAVERIYGFMASETAQRLKARPVVALGAEVQ